MILTFILQIINAFINWLISWLPEGDLPALISTGWTYLINLLWSFDWLIPTRTLLTLFILSVVAELAIWAFDLAHWIYMKFRGTR